nr:MAG TPA: hypothetical protein [Caudoviricetes sp.]
MQKYAISGIISTTFVGLYSPYIDISDIFIRNSLIIKSVQKCPVSDKKSMADKNVRQCKNAV